jgi:hypothetical protein
MRINGVDPVVREGSCSNSRAVFVAVAPPFFGGTVSTCADCMAPGWTTVVPKPDDKPKQQGKATASEKNLPAVRLR